MHVSSVLLTTLALPPPLMHAFEVDTYHDWKCEQFAGHLSLPSDGTCHKPGGGNAGNVRSVKYNSTDGCQAWMYNHEGCHLKHELVGATPPGNACWAFPDYTAETLSSMKCGE